MSDTKPAPEISPEALAAYIPEPETEEVDDGTN